MITASLLSAIEAHATRLRQTNPLVVRAAAGTLSEAEVLCYLASAGHMTLHTVTHLRRAETIARCRGWSALAAFLRAKGADEAGHEAWTHHDIDVMRAVSRADPKVVPAIHALVRALEETIDADPHLYLPYMLWAESITVLLGGEFVRNLTERCGIRIDALTSLTRHIELDAEHVAQGTEALDALLGDGTRAAALHASLARFTALFDRACAQMVS